MMGWMGMKVFGRSRIHQSRSCYWALPLLLLLVAVVARPLLLSTKIRLNLLAAYSSPPLLLAFLNGCEGRRLWQQSEQQRRRRWR
jgi:hypothetical protein